jgi:hypothetical protein
MKLTREHIEARYPAQVKTDEECGQAWMSLMREMELQLKRTGLTRDDVTFVVHAPSGKAFPQWIGAASFIPVLGQPQKL